MAPSPLDLTDLGWSDSFEPRSGRCPGSSFARVAAVDRELLLLLDAEGPFRARLAGSYRHRLDRAEERPCVGDWVSVERGSGDGVGIVHSLLERRTVLRRRAAGDAVESQLIAANVDVVFVVQSCHFDFNLNRLERYLVMVREGGAEPVVLLTKTDLVEPEVLASQLAEIRATGITVPVLTLSNVTREGTDELRRHLLRGRTHCFIGSSGVGKSTLINHLLGHEALVTKSVSGTGEGRHTTVRRELLLLEGGALVIDNPGMRELGILDAEDGLGSSFSDIEALAAGCRFRDCTHANEPGCAVREAVRSGAIGRKHFENYGKLRAEADFAALSQVERRRKDRDFGRFIKEVKKSLRRHD